LPANLSEIFQKTYQEVRLGASLPDIRADFYPFVNVKNTIARRGDSLRVRVSDQLTDAPQDVLVALAHQLLVKVYRRRPSRKYVLLYRQYITSHDFYAKAHATRQARGRKRLSPPAGDIYHLEEIFERELRAAERARQQHAEQLRLVQRVDDVRRQRLARLDARCGLVEQGRKRQCARDPVLGRRIQDRKSVIRSPLYEAGREK